MYCYDNLSKSLLNSSRLRLILFLQIVFLNFLENHANFETPKTFIKTFLIFYFRG